MDDYGYLFIEIAPQFAGRVSAVLAILAHEACHHILDLSGIRGSSREETEKITDLAMFICGFGAVFLQGHSEIRQTDAGWEASHLGYLTADQYRLAQEWVLTAQSLPVLGERFTTDGLKRQGIFARFMAWLRGQRTASGAAKQVGHRHSSDATSSRPPLVDAGERQRQIVLGRLGGNHAALQRLMEYERRKQPNADEITLLDAVLESLERDRS